jgi:hypothetical protein
MLWSIVVGNQTKIYVNLIVYYKYNIYKILQEGATSKIV